ncbi:37S ribosomal protein S24, mitochondrial [Coemansia sp. RSA 2706]|nr:37S ribosomal protein S24, mitochondrial [Coemansia sp. RSA 2708]KAJ2307025.1 37S ribosomal protein S24, mitochondrial [Coemansia sp. RSA 2706]
MSSLFARHTRLVQTVWLARNVHVSGVQPVGRKSRKEIGKYKQHQAAERKVRAEIYKEEDQAYGMEEVPEFEYNDHHTFGHMLLESVRDVRKYARQTKYELPTLAEHARPFRLPPSQNILQFERSFTMGEKYLAQDRKVVLRVKVAKLGLKGAELRKFVLLAGVRYTPETDELRMSESREITSLLNKKRLADTLVELIAEAKKQDDTFADVPMDFSYREFKPKPRVPRRWLSEQEQTRLKNKAQSKAQAKPTEVQS